MNQLPNIEMGGASSPEKAAEALRVFVIDNAVEVNLETAKLNIPELQIPA